ncbi:hypothetical protein [Flavobacterium sp. 7A]|nr:hypothetical protein [Flavobacterium sp. 7A]MCW2121153.1 hypothetical protein [Flavobacterium sp. 7A]
MKIFVGISIICSNSVVFIALTEPLSLPIISSKVKVSIAVLPSLSL